MTSVFWILIGSVLVSVLVLTRVTRMALRVSRASKQTEQRYQSLFEHHPDAVYSIDKRGQFLSSNPACLRISGYQPHELAQRSFDSLLTEETRGVAQRYFERAVEGEAQHYEVTLLHKQGHEVHLSVTNLPMVVAGEIVGIYGVARDITANKQAEAALRESEERFQMIATSMTDLISIFDTTGRHLYVTPSCAQVFGYPQEHYLGHSGFDFAHPEDRMRVAGEFQKMVLTKEPHSVEFRHEHREHGYVLIEARGYPVTDEQGNVVRLIISARDITEQRKTEEFLRQSDKLAVAGQLAAGVAHEIRNPLTSIKGFAQLLKQRGDAQDYYYEIMLDELDRIDFIVNEFLVLAKPQANHFLQKDLGLLLQQIVALLETQAILSNVQLHLHVDEQLPLIYCEENRLKQVFINLLKNAVEAMPDGGQVQINVSRATDDHVLVRVTDEGCGIPADRLPKLGEPFYTTKEKGTGLGLMVSHKIIKDHQGELDILSEVGVGTTVEIRLPIEWVLPAMQKSVP